MTKAITTNLFIEVNYGFCQQSHAAIMELAGRNYDNPPAGCVFVYAGLVEPA